MHEQYQNILLSTLNSFGNYTSKDLKLLSEVLIDIEFDKNEIILKKGTVCSEVYFIIEGAAYQYEIDENLDQKIIDLYSNKQWCFNVKSFASKQPSESSIITFKKTIAYKLSIDTIHELIAKSPSFLQLGKILDIANKRVQYFDKNYTPDEKYKYLLKEDPDFILKFPQKIIASYLKITPETLSRVRNRITK